MKQYNFINTTFFKKDEKDKNQFDQFVESDLNSIHTKKPKGILDPNVSIIKVKDVEKGS